MRLLHTPAVGGVWKPYVHTNCGHNFRAGLLLRTLGATPGASEWGEGMFANSMSLLRKVIRGRVGIVEPWSTERVIARYSEARMRVRYEEAARSLREDGLCVRSDSFVKGFVKGEKTKPSKVHKPRVIMARSPRYNLELATYLCPIEHVVYSAFRGWGSSFYTRTRLIGKGLNPAQRAALLKKKFDAAAGMVAFEVDGKSFESHLSRHQLSCEHGFYKSLCPSRRLQKLLSWQEVFGGAGPDGVSYVAEGVRASGDFNTGLGNTLIMCGLVYSVAQALGTKFDFLADGDNAVVFVSRADLPRWSSELPGIFVHMGHEAEVGKTAYEFPEIEFGQSRPVLVGGDWTMVRNPFKVLSHACGSYEYYRDLEADMPVLRAVGYCEAVLGAGVPVLQSFAAAILRATSRVSKRSFERVFRRRLTDYEHQRVLARGISWELAAPRAVTREARQTFSTAWGVAVEEQLRLESLFDRGLDLPSAWSHGSMMDSCLGKSSPWYWDPASVV